MSAPSKNAYEVIQPPSSLKDKVGGADPEAGLDAVLERADAAMSQMEDSFLEQVAIGIGGIQKAFNALVGCSSNRGEAIDHIVRFARILEDTGRGFDYTLMADVAAGLGRAFADRADLDAKQLATVKVHIDVLRFIVARRMAGSGGDRGQRLGKALELLGERVFGDRRAYGA